MTVISSNFTHHFESYMPLPISVFIVTKNEANNIDRLLTSLKDFDEVIVVDSGSTDDTVAIAKQHGARIIERDWPGYSKQKQYAMEQCKNDWSINLDADEQLPKNLIPAIKDSIQDETIDAIRFLRVDYFMGKPMPKYISLPKNVRLYRKSKANFDSTCLVHESAAIKGKTKLIRIPFYHYGYNDYKLYSEKLKYYAELKAEEKFKKGKKASLIKLGLSFPFEFLRKLIIQRYVLFGWRGFVLSFLNARYSFMKEWNLFKKQ